MGSPEERLKELGVALPGAPSPVANYVPAVRAGNLLFLSGTLPAAKPDGEIPRGKLGDSMSV